MPTPFWRDFDNDQQHLHVYTFFMDGPDEPVSDWIANIGDMVASVEAYFAKER